ncbi:MAG: class GN sortase [Oceanicoccus sp.]
MSSQPNALFGIAAMPIAHYIYIARKTIRLKHLLAIVPALVGLLLLIDSLWIYSKAIVAQLLIEDAWQITLVSGEVVKPWPWADTWPVARLQYEAGDIDLYVLNGAQGSSLAFGPAYLMASSTPGSDGLSIISGHNDTHFRFIQHLQPGDILQITAADNRISRYQVTSLSVVDSQSQPLQVNTDINALMLITCYPFGAIQAGGNLRYLVVAERVSDGMNVSKQWLEA